MTHSALCEAIPTIAFFLKPNHGSGGGGTVLTIGLIALIALALAFFTMPVVYIERDDEDIKKVASLVYGWVAIANCLVGGFLLVVSLGFSAVEYLKSGLVDGDWSGPASYLPINAYTAVALCMAVGGMIVGYVAVKIEPPRPSPRDRRKRAPRDTDSAALTSLGLGHEETTASGDVPGANVGDGSVETLVSRDDDLTEAR